VKLSEIGEFGFIDRISGQGKIRAEGVVKGIGDDCAVIDLGGPEYLLLTTDLIVEKVHFLLDWSTPDIVGARSLTANLSDIAACGGIPRDAFLSLAIPDYVEVEWLDGFYQGLTSLARTYNVNVLGGDTTSSQGHLVINIAVTGLVSAGEVLLRHTARAGDIIVLTGPTGLSRAGCEILLKSQADSGMSATSLVKAHLQPRPHLEEGRILAASGACTAAIDVSDGISSDLGHLCHDSVAGAVLYEDKIPVADELIEMGPIVGKHPLDWVLNGGEDYVLLAAVNPRELDALLEQASQAGRQFYPIGEFVSGHKMELVCLDGSIREIRPAGWDHFA
jgi:thiamine-monophosphate kinase